MAEVHYHRSKEGFLTACYNSCRNILGDYRFWIGVTISFPLEHFLWEKVWPFYLLTEAMGL